MQDLKMAATVASILLILTVTYFVAVRGGSVDLPMPWGQSATVQVPGPREPPQSARPDTTPSGSETQAMASVDVTAPSAPPSREERPSRSRVYEGWFDESAEYADVPRCYVVDFPSVPPGTTREQVIQTAAVVVRRICSAPEEDRARLANGCEYMEFTSGTVTQMCYHATPRNN